MPLFFICGWKTGLLQLAGRWSIQPGEGFMANSYELARAVTQSLHRRPELKFHTRKNFCERFHPNCAGWSAVSTRITAEHD